MFKLALSTVGGAAVIRSFLWILFPRGGGIKFEGPATSKFALLPSKSPSLVNLEVLP
jgi:hypothetical protein